MSYWGSAEGVSFDGGSFSASDGGSRRDPHSRFAGVERSSQGLFRTFCVFISLLLERKLPRESRASGNRGARKEIRGLPDRDSPIDPEERQIRRVGNTYERCL
jgi:hypothetical protein